MGGIRSAPCATRGASDTDDGSGATVAAASAESSGAVAPARGEATSVRPSRTSGGGGGGGSRSVGAANEERGSVSSTSSSSKQRWKSRTRRPITLRNMARQRSAAKPDEWPMQNRTTGGQLGLHRWSATETHSDRNHRNPRRKPEPANSSQQCLRKPYTCGECGEPKHAQRIVKAGLILDAASQPAQQ